MGVGKGIRANKGREPTLGKVVIQLSPEEVVRFVRILTDEDRDEALAFLKEVMKPRVGDATREH
jgi:hypothetical protein